MRRTQRLPLEELAPYLWEAQDRRPAGSISSDAANASTEEEQTPGLLPPVSGLPPPASPIDWQTIFRNSNPVEIEVGCGKGLFIVNAAQSCPDVNFFGIEIVRKYQLYTATRVAIRKLANVRMACADAKPILRDCVPLGSVQAIHVYYPDPWWKKRHHKRRLFTPDFVESCTKALKTGGLFHLATDVEEYFAVMIDLCRQRSELRELPAPQLSTGKHDMDYLTNFERKARKKGQPVFRALFEKIAA